MQLARMFRCMFAAVVCLTAAAGAANAATLDFTDPSGAGDGSLTGNFAGTTYELSTNGGAITFNPVPDGSTCAILVCAGDGLGIGDDEVSSAVRVGAGEVLTIKFGTALAIDKIFLLDLFTSLTGPGAERATVAYDGGSVDINADPSETPNGDSGFRVYVFGSPVVTSFLEFSAPSVIDVNDNLGVNDYAVAGISTTPLPAALPIYLTGLGLLGLLGWLKRRRAAAV